MGRRLGWVGHTEEAKYHQAEHHKANKNRLDRQPVSPGYGLLRQPHGLPNIHWAYVRVVGLIGIDEVGEMSAEFLRLGGRRWRNVHDGLSGRGGLHALFMDIYIVL